MMARATDAVYAAAGPNYDVVELSHSNVKPGIPPLLPIALILWAACAVCYTCFQLLDIQAAAFVGIACAATCMACIGAAAILRRKSVLVLGAASVLAGVALAAYGAYQVQFAGQNFIGIPQIWEFTMLEDAKPGAFGSACSASAVGENGIYTRVRVNFSEEEGLLQGDVISAKATLRHPKPESAGYFWSRGLSAQTNVSAYEAVPSAFPVAALHALRASTIELFAEYGGEQAGLLQALVCGYRNTMQQSGEYEGYKVVGLAHLVAVSGAHLAIVTMLFGWLLDALRSPRWLRTAATVLFVLAYLVFSGIPLSALRAAFMVVLSTTAVLAKRRAASLNSLAFCIIVFLAFDPSVAVSVSFFLSAGSTLGIVLFAGLVSSWFSGLSGMAKKLVAEPLGLTLSSNVITLPYSAALFSQVPLLAPLANVVAAPLFSLACVSGLVFACIANVASGIAAFAIGVAAACTLPLSAAVDAFSSVPYTCIAVQLPVWPMIVLSAGLCLVLWLVWPRLRMAALAKAAGALCAASFALIFIAPRFSADELVMLDVGQGDALLIRSGGVAVLVDTGNQEGKLKENLGALGVYALDAVVVTHHDDDHMGCLESLSSYENIGAVYSAEDALSCSCGNCAELRRAASAVCPEGLQGLRVGDSVKVGKFCLAVIWPETYADEGGNGDSVCLLLNADCDSDGRSDWQALLTGDTESEQLVSLLKGKVVGDIDILKVGHHGSKVTLTDAVAESLSPEVALISVGANNRYGHPSQEALDILEDVGSRVYRTDADGTVKVTFTKEKLTVSTTNSA